MKTVLALDQGTTGSTALVIGQDGAVLGRGYREFQQYFPKPGWVEHDPAEIFDVTVAAAHEALRMSGTIPEAVGITNQRETVVVWDRKTGKPLHRALVWQDRRTAERCRALATSFGSVALHDKTGLVWDPYFSGTKIEWLLQNDTEVAASARRGDAVFGTIDSWLIYNLSGGKTLGTDPTNASRTLLYNIRDHQWDRDLLDLFGVPEECLVDVHPSSGVVGVCQKDLFGAEIPIAGNAGDQQAALYGQSCWSAGEGKCTYGTGAFLLLNLGDTMPSGSDSGGLLTTVACDAQGGIAYAFEGSIFIAGAAIQWLRDGLGIIANAAESESLAADLEDTGGVYFVPALVGMAAPYWEAEARGTIVGLTRGTSSAHLVRAGLEAMAYGTKDVVDAMTTHSGVSLAEMKVDGGAAANDWTMQFLADTLGVPVARPDIVETTALGAAGLAGLATGVWESPTQFAESRTYRNFTPIRTRLDEYQGWKRAVETALYWARSAQQGD